MKKWKVAYWAVKAKETRLREVVIEAEDGTIKGDGTLVLHSDNQLVKAFAKHVWRTVEQVYESPQCLAGEEWWAVYHTEGCTCRQVPVEDKIFIGGTDDCPVHGFGEVEKE